MAMVIQLAFLCISSLFLLLSDQVVVGNGQITQVKVGVVVANTNDSAGKMALTTLQISLSDFYAAHPEFRTRLVLHPRSSGSDVVTSASAVLDLIKEAKVEAIIGPQTSMEAHFAISLGDKAHVPIISYSATSELLSSLGSDYFIQATQVDSTQVPAITSLIEAFGWRQVVPINVDNEFGGGLIPTLIDALQDKGIHIPYRSVISPVSTRDQIVAELYKLKSMATRVFIVHMEPNLGTRLFSTAKNLGMMSEDYAWIITNGIGNSFHKLSSKKLQSMRGVVGLRTYFPTSPQLERFNDEWKRNIVKKNIDVSHPRVSVFDLWAYDAITALASAVEQVGGTIFEYEKTSSSDGSSTDLSMFGVSKAGKRLSMAIHGTKFKGLSGDFMLNDGQLQSYFFEIINVNEESKISTMGFYTPRNGLLSEMNSTYSSLAYSIATERLGSFLWPGGSNNPPTGWVVPTNEKKLRILVPIKAGFDQFVKVEPVAGKGKLRVTGYCIDIFEAVIKSLPYPVSYEFFTLKGPPTKTYDELTDEVYFQRYDAAVGDITVLANRSSYVDFTFPYTTSGITMIAPIKDKSSMTWVFIRPLSWGLWVTTLCYFVLFAFVVWVLEHPINPDLTGRAEVDQVGASLYYAFSTVVFAHSHHVFNNMARCVVIIWLFFLLILTQSYTASLASMLTVRKLQSTISGINELKETGMPVGVQEGSFVRELLLKEHGFAEGNLMSFRSVSELEDLLQKGPHKGGIAAAIDETPYMKVFLATHCSKYMIVPPTNKTDGLGFAFPLGSPLVADISRQVLNVTEGDQMVAIESKWFGQQASCPESTSTLVPSSTRLGLASFKELFIITGCAAVGVLIAFIISFLHEHKVVWLKPEDTNVTLYSMVMELSKQFYRKNTRTHPIETPNDGSSTPAYDFGGADEASMEQSMEQSTTHTSPLQH